MTSNERNLAKRDGRQERLADRDDQVARSRRFRGANTVRKRSKKVVW